MIKVYVIHYTQQYSFDSSESWVGDTCFTSKRHALFTLADDGYTSVNARLYKNEEGVLAEIVELSLKGVSND